ncbi:hypothetical protein A9Q84_14655 [Halobacteriovorax marinus]|uniref:Uncharacterized protein n=1 Tax=Halobacteriovorax marinus TaxID=97084 RepID=A0A1Y5F5G9_9BACT|nr:hypothetical protein A9Q84_14655 [Halobacteriovorax marinus]
MNSLKTLARFESFYIETKPLENSMYFRDALNFDKNEEVHDFFQWLFPIDTISEFNKSVPLFDETIKFFLTTNSLARANFHVALESFKCFLDGHELWPSVMDHNNLRVTRVLKCLRLLHKYDELYDFYRFILCEIAINEDSFSLNTLDHWRSATFEKTIFLCVDDLKMREEVVDFLKCHLPDHWVINLQRNAVSKFLALNEPIFTNAESNQIISGVDWQNLEFFNRGRVFKLSELMRTDNPYMLDKIRHWY